MYEIGTKLFNRRTGRVCTIVNKKYGRPVCATDGYIYTVEDDTGKLVKTSSLSLTLYFTTEANR